MKKQISAKIRKELIKACLANGIEDAKEIQAVAKDVMKSCSRQQVAGVKAWIRYPNMRAA